MIETRKHFGAQQKITIIWQCDKRVVWTSCRQGKRFLPTTR